MRRLGSVVTVSALVLAFGQRTYSFPSAGANCTNCHGDVAGTVTVTGNDATANPAEACGSPDQGLLKVFRVTQGSSKTLSATLSDLSASATFATVVKGFGNGVGACQPLAYSGDATWTQRTNGGATYFTQDGNAAIAFNISVAANTPPDYYDLVLGAAGLDNGLMFYTESHVYLQVVSADVPLPTVPSIALDTTSLTPGAAQGANATDEAFTIANGGQGTLSYSITSNVPWLMVAPASGSSTGSANSHTVQYNTASLAAGTHNATITVTDANAANSPQTIQVTLTITPAGGVQTPSIVLSRNSLSAAANQRSIPPSDSFTVANGGEGTLNYQITSSDLWLVVTPTGGSSTGAANTHAVIYYTTGLGVGTYRATLTVADADAANTPQKIDVSLTITEAPPLTSGGGDEQVGDDSNDSAEQGVPDDAPPDDAPQTPVAGGCGAGSVSALSVVLMGFAGLRISYFRRRVAGPRAGRQW